MESYLELDEMSQKFRHSELDSESNCEQMLNQVQHDETTFNFQLSTFHSHKRVAFTLAEVLITLGVIGVVAALTMPTLINNINNKDKSAKLKKFYSTISQVFVNSELDNGPAGDWDLAPILRDENNKIIDDPNSALSFFEKYLKPYLKTIDSGIENFNRNGKVANYAYFILADGSTSFLLNGGGCLDITYDINGVKNPNKFGYDQFEFLYCDKNNNANYLGSNNVYFGTYEPSSTREDAKSNCISKPYTCTSLLIHDNWEFKDDYPWK